MTTQKVYKNPNPGQALLTTISAGCKTPVLEIKFCNLVKGFYYPNSSIPRYSITCVVDPIENKEFLKEIQAIEKNEKVESIIKYETAKEDGKQVNTGKLIIKFQSKDMIPVYVKPAGGEPELIELQDELAKGEKVFVIYDILRYTKKNTMTTEYGLSFKPSCIYYYPTKQIAAENP